METHTHTHPYFRLRGLTLALAASGLLWSPTSHAQLITDVNASLLQESALSAVLAARRMSTEMQLYSLAQELIAQANDIDPQSNPAAANNGLKAAPSSSGSYGQVKRKKNTQATLLALPSSTSSQRDSNGIPIGYCRFNPAQGSPSASDIAFAIISAGNDGRFGTDCDTLRNPSSPVNSDDIAVRVTFEQMSLAGTQASNFGATVDSYGELTGLKARIYGGSVTARQVRLVKNLNQLFVAAVDASGNVSWTPLTPTAVISNASENRADFRWMSGAVGIGANSISGRPATLSATLTGTNDASSRSTLTLGNVSSNAAGSVLPDSRAVGISLLDDSSTLRTYVGLSGAGQTAFSIRHNNAQGAVNERLRISSDGRLWLGDVPLNETPSLPSDAARTVYSILSGDMQLGSGIASVVNGGRIGRILYIGDTMAGQNAFMRAMESNSSSGLVPVLMLGMQNAVTGGLGSGHILFNTTGNVGIKFDGLSIEQIPTATLDVNGSVRVREGLLLDSTDVKPMTLKSRSAYNFGNEIVIDSTISGLTQIATIGMGNGLEPGARERNFYINVNNEDRLTINKLGNIGIGTNVPRARMEITGTPDATPLLRASAVDSQTGDLLQLFAAGGVTPAVSVDRTGMLNANAGLTATSGTFSRLSVAGPATFNQGLVLGANLADSFTDNVIRGAAGAMHITSEFGLHLILDNNDNNAGSDFAFTVGRGGFLSNESGYSEMMRINAVGNMGLGTAAPSARLDIVGTQAGLPLLRATAMSGQTADLFQLNSATSSVPLFKVDANGNLSGRAAEFSGALTAQGATLLHDLVLSPASMGLNEGIGIYFKDPDGGTGPAAIVYRDTGTPELEVSSRLKVLGLLTANDGLTATTGIFSGLLTASNGLDVNNAVLNANGGLTVTGNTSAQAATFTNLTASTGNFTQSLGTNGNMTVDGNLSVAGLASLNGGLGASSGTFSQLLRADGGLTVKGDTSAQAATFEGPLRANNGLNTERGILTGSEATFTNLLANTGSFKQSLNTDGNMTVGGNLSVAGLASLNGGLNVTGNSTLNGTLTVNGKIAGLNTVAMQFLGYTGPNNSNPASIGNATLDINTGAVQIFLAQANPNLYSIDQNLSSGNTPTFNGMRLNSGGLSSSGVISTSSSFQGYLDGTARDANRLNTTLRLRFLQNAGEGPYSIAEFDLREGNGLMERDIVVNATPIINYNSNNTIDNADHRSVNVTTGAVQFSNFTINCTVQGGNSSSTNCVVPNFNASVTAQADSNSFLQGNNYSNQLSGNTFNASPITQYQVTNQLLGSSASVNFATKAGMANQLENPVTLRLKGDFINDASVSFQSGGVVDLTLASKGLTYAKNMNQDVKTDSTVTFSQLTAAQASINGDLSTKSIQVQGPATVQSLSVVNGGQTVIALNGATLSARIGEVTINGSDNSITANRFIGTADKATRLAQDLAFNFQGVISGTTSTSNGFNYTINTSIGPGAITNDMIKELHGNKLTGLSVDTAQLANGAVKTDKIFDGAVTADKLGIDAVITEKIKNEAVTTNKLAPDAVIFKARNLESSSDIRLKHSITRVDGNSLLQRLSQTLLYGYQFNSDPEQKRQLGVIAQELQPLFPELVTVQKDGPDAGFFAVNYGVLGAVAAAGVGELNRKLDALGIRIKNATTVEASLPTFAVTRIEGVNARFEKLDADEITAKTARFEKLDAQQFVTDKSRSKQLQADTLNSGSTEGFGMGGGLMLFSAVQDGHYLVQVSAADGSHATASVFVSGGVVSVVPVGGSDISIAASAGTVYAVGPGKHMKASWLKTG